MHGDLSLRADAISPDGKRLVFEQLTSTNAYDLMLLDLSGPTALPAAGAPRVQPLLQTPFDERRTAISPDGRWIAYEANLGLPTGRTYGVSRDGQRFLMIKDRTAANDKAPPPSMVVVVNWFAELK